MIRAGSVQLYSGDGSSSEVKYRESPVFGRAPVAPTFVLHQSVLHFSGCAIG